MKNYNYLVKRLNISSAIILTTDIKPTVVDTSLCVIVFLPTYSQNEECGG